MEYPKVNGTGRSEKQESTESTTTLLKQLTENMPEGVRGNGSPSGEIRRTSDLFDMLQQALSVPPPPSTGLPRPREAPRRLIHIEIEGAESIPKFPGRINKKPKKKHKNHIRATIQEPNTFVTFEAFPVADEITLVKTYSTAVIENNCNPAWHSNFSIFVSADAQNLPLKVWRRSTNQSDDVLIGMASLTLLPNVSEKCDIVDASGHNAGKLKVRVFPAPETTATPTEDALLSGLGPALTNLVFPLSADHELGNVSFSRALKRKFTELEEISQRLRARLHDVTGDANFDPDDEFEHDLNTRVDEEEVAQPGNSGAYAWLGLNEEEKRKYIHTEVTKELFVDVDEGNQSIDLSHIETALEQTAITDEDKLNGV